jgi:magnesium-transporting ATPase (P-type)
VVFPQVSASDRTPLQILFLILVTDLPPSIALGMEPGEPGILKLCLGWAMGLKPTFEQ